MMPLASTPQEKINALTQQLQDYQRLTRLLETLLSSREVDDTLQQISEAILQLCDADQSAIFLFAPAAGQEAKTLIREGTSRENLLDHYLNKLLAGWVTAHGRALLSDDLPAALGAKNVKEKYHNITALMSVPLQYAGTTIGVVNLLSERNGRKFGERELRLMTVLAAQCAQFIHNARLRESLFAENIRLKQEVLDSYARQGIIGRSEEMQAVFALLDRVIPTGVRVLLEGESGTGKERIARAIHYSGPRREAPFVAIDCGALPANLLESELFGYLKGSFTGADRDRKGLFEEAHGGTLFLDEIANMPLEIQSKFLRAVQEGEVRPLGSGQVKKVDVRIIAAASGDLRKQVETGKFREDLFYRLNVAVIALPPLRERRADIAILANHFLHLMNQRHQLQIVGFAPETVAMLERYAWPGNIRELEHAVERALIFCSGARLTPEDFAFLAAAQSVQNSPLPFRPRPLKDALTELKRDYIVRVLTHCGGSQKEAAALLQIQPTYLSRLVKELGV